MLVWRRERERDSNPRYGFEKILRNCGTLMGFWIAKRGQRKTGFVSRNSSERGTSQSAIAEGNWRETYANIRVNKAPTLSSTA